MMYEPELIIPDWPAPARVRAISTTRVGGYSAAPWDSFNLGGHVNDDPERVEQNRGKLASLVGLPRASLCFMRQVHGTDIETLPAVTDAEADGCVTSQALTPCVIMTADCLPVLFCNRAGTRVAAAHAGWRGLCHGVLEQTIAQFDAPDDVLAWLGPAIGPQWFEVGAEVRRAFLEKDPQAHKAFLPGRVAGRFMGDLYQLARQRLSAAGVSAVYGGHWCTYSESDRFFSFRRDGVTGRMASLVFIE